VTGVTEIVVREVTDMVVGIQSAEQLVAVTVTIIFIAIIAGMIMHLLLTEDTSTDYFYDDYKRFV
jgi:hypothetical protein